MFQSSVVISRPIGISTFPPVTSIIYFITATFCSLSYFIVFYCLRFFFSCSFYLYVMIKITSYISSTFHLLDFLFCFSFAFNSFSHWWKPLMYLPLSELLGLWYSCFKILTLTHNTYQHQHYILLAHKMMDEWYYSCDMVWAVGNVQVCTICVRGDRGEGGNHWNSLTAHCIRWGKAARA